MRCSLWLTSQFEQRSICVFSSYYIYIYVFIFIYLFISILSPLHLHHPWRETCYIMSFFYIINILMTFSKNCRRTVGARLRPDRPFLVTSLYTFFLGGRFGVPLLEAYINMIYLRPVCVRCSGISFGSTLFDLFGVNPIDTYMFDHFWLNCAGNRSQIVVFQVGTIPVIWLSNRFISCLNRPHHPHFFLWITTTSLRHHWNDGCARLKLLLGKRSDPGTKFAGKGGA